MLTAREHNILAVIRNAYPAEELEGRFPPVIDRAYFIEDLRPVFDTLLAAGFIEPLTQYVITEAGRRALQSEERDNG